MRYFHLIASLVFFTACTPKQTIIAPNTDDIRVNQVGFYLNAPKSFVVVNSAATSFQVIDVTNNELVFSGELSDPMNYELSGESVRTGSFASFKKPGRYLINIPGFGSSHNFEINTDPLNKALLASLKSNYYQRASSELLERHAGYYARAAGHLDDQVLFHPSTGRSGTINSPKGWYDAGDFGKYVINGAYALGQMLMLYEQYPTTIGDVDLNIPETGNGINDLLDEMKYEMDWLLTMQDDDGGVFFKLTTLNFSGMIMPSEGKAPRYIIGKGTASTLDFAAVAAKMARHFPDEKYQRTLQEAAIKAWNWAQSNPSIAYKNPVDVSTGEYGDSDFHQEKYWAASELYLLTNDMQYLNAAKKIALRFEYKEGDTWRDFMKYIGAFALIDQLKATDAYYARLQAQIIGDADRLLAKLNSNDYRQALDDFQWGSNSDVLNTAIIMSQAYRQSGNQKYLDGVHESVDYVFGKNATGYSFVSGFGSKTPMFLHHRASVADGIAEPVPGFISGGPNHDQQDAKDVKYQEGVKPMKSWVDVVPSYASNEVCLNWNAPLTYILGFLSSEAH